MTTAKTTTAIPVAPGGFEPENHYYERVLNAHLHPLVRYFRGLGNDRIAERYCHLHPEAQPAAVHAALARQPRHFRWGGADLFHVTTERGMRKMVVIETNSSPSGQKSMPFDDIHSGQGGYKTLIESSFLPMLKRRGTPRGGLAVLHDKNFMETSGYAAALADVTGETVWRVPMVDGDPDPAARFDNGLLEVRAADGKWHPIRGAFRYVTQRPWNRIPPITRTVIFNPVLVCLAGGRNKLLAAKAYDFYNAELRGTGLAVRYPETIWDVSKPEVPIWVRRMGGVAVVKVPYSNAGQGVFTITSPEELDAFMAAEHSYEHFIVQALVGNSGWSSETAHGRLYHVGTVPNRHGQIYAADLRFMVGAGPDGYFPVATYARRAPSPLLDHVAPGQASWSMLGTNLSFRDENGVWQTQPERLLLMDARDFNRLGLGLDDLIEAYIQTVLAMTAIDEMAQRLVSSKGTFRSRLFQTLNPDRVLAEEIRL